MNSVMTISHYWVLCGTVVEYRSTESASLRLNFSKEIKISSLLLARCLVVRPPSRHVHEQNTIHSPTKSRNFESCHWIDKRSIDIFLPLITSAAVWELSLKCFDWFRPVYQCNVFVPESILFLSRFSFYRKKDNNKKNVSDYFPVKTKRKSKNKQTNKYNDAYFWNRTVKLNGKVLKLVDDRTLPDLAPKSVPGDEPLNLPPLTFGFYVIPKVSASACG